MSVEGKNHIPGLCNNDIVEWVVRVAEACKTDAKNHFTGCDAFLLKRRRTDRVVDLDWPPQKFSVVRMKGLSEV